VVSLWEAYSYASFSTKSDKVLGETNAQNPGFDMDLVGRSDLDFIQLDNKKTNVQLEQFSSLPLYIYKSGSNIPFGTSHFSILPSMVNKLI
jgi:hypothetical protein